MTMPLIGVPGRRASEANNVRGKAISSGRMYADAIHRAGGLPIVIPPSNDPDVIASTIQRCDGIVMPGGGDVNPTCYGHTENAELRIFRLACENGERQRRACVDASCGLVMLIHHQVEARFICKQVLVEIAIV